MLNEIRHFYANHHWDITLAVVVSVQSTFLAYLHHPKWKAFLLSLPLPFTCAFLAVGRPIDATNIIGMFLLLAYTHGVRLLYQKMRIPIIPAIAIAAIGYCLVGTWLARRVPPTPMLFWLGLAAVFATAVVLNGALLPREEPGHRTSLPVWVKMPIMIGVVAALMTIKSNLLGFTTMFPMVSIIASYEARHSMWTICRQIPLIMLMMGSMMTTMYLAQRHFTTGITLVLGWVVLIVLLLFFSRETLFGPTPAPAKAVESTEA